MSRAALFPHAPSSSPRTLAHKRTGAALAAGIAFLVGAPAQADAPRFGPHDARVAFVVAKNTNRNEVAYGVRLDASCQPVGDAPVYAYWRQLERGPEATEDLTFLDRSVYGISSQRVLARGPEQSKVLITIKAAPGRGVAILVRKRDGQCTAEAIATVQGGPARLDRVFVHVPSFLRVDWVELQGHAGDAPVVERVAR